MGCLTTEALTVGGALLAPVTGGLSAVATGSMLGTVGLMAAGGAAGYLVGEELGEAIEGGGDVGSIPPATSTEEYYTQTQTQLLQKQIEQMDMQIAEQKKMNEEVDAYLAKTKAQEEVLANDPEYQRIKSMEDKLVKKSLENALGLTVLTPEQIAEIDTQWNTAKEAAQAQIERSYSDVVGKISSGREEDLATIDADYTKLLAMVDREIPEKTTEAWRSVSPLMRDSATAASAMAKLATEVSRVKEDLIASQATAKEGVTRRARAGTTEATTEKARATEQLTKETEAGKLGAYEAKKYGLGTGYSSLPPYYTTNLEAQKRTTELQTTLLPYNTKLGISQNVVSNLLGSTQSAQQAQEQAYTQRVQPWQVKSTLEAQSSINAYNQRMALLGATISGASRLGAAYIAS